MSVARPWLSVLVPTFNGAAFLSRALDSVLAEGSSGVEVLAVDDGSSDGTLGVLESYKGRLELSVVERRAGSWVANTNLALRQAAGEWVSLLHQDDFWLPGRLAALRARLTESPRAALALHGCLFVDREGRVLGPWRVPLPCGPTAMFRREPVLALGGLDEGLWYTADWDLWLRLAAAGPTVCVPGALAAFRVHAGSQTVARSGSLEAFRGQYETVLERHFHAWTARSARIRAAVGRAARASVEINVSLAAAYHGQPVPWRALLCALARLRPADWHRLGRDSRLVERVLARLRARLRAPA